MSTPNKREKTKYPIYQTEGIPARITKPEWKGNMENISDLSSWLIYFAKMGEIKQRFEEQERKRDNDYPEDYAEERESK